MIIQKCDTILVQKTVMLLNPNIKLNIYGVKTIEDSNQKILETG